MHTNKEIKNDKIRLLEFYNSKIININFKIILKEVNKVMSYYIIIGFECLDNLVMILG